ncbi:MAG: arylsulfatase A, partial [Yoonia sp.]
FTSDNGPWTMFGPHGGTASPLRGEKGTSWEGGFRVPAIFHWPGKIKPGTVAEMAANLDLYATFAALSKGKVPTREKGFISQDLSRVLLQGEASPRTQWFLSGGSIAFRSGDFKIHTRTKNRSSNPDTRKREPIAIHDPPLLFDLSKDLSERKNIAAQHPGIVARLLKEMNGFRNGN